MIFGGTDAVYSKRQQKRDHPSHVARLGHYPLIVDPIVHKKRLTKVLMDGGSGLNILYVDTLDAMRIPRSELRSMSSPFHGVINLPVTFGDRANFCSKVLTFKVVDFPGFNIKLNPKKCVFGVPKGKLLRYIMSERGIKANPEKITAISNMGPICNIKGVQRLTDCLATLSRFISWLSEWGMPLYKLLKKIDAFVWTEEAQ
ncbi:uncharacterized protein [Miscanthus floridulus]|uniref:uncharacterized protein n=1 Tax=Miscanthus floridulus TaxID=154761 RepID=UPI003459E95F